MKEEIAPVKCKTCEIRQIFKLPKYILTPHRCPLKKRSAQPPKREGKS